MTTENNPAGAGPSLRVRVMRAFFACYGLSTITVMMTALYMLSCSEWLGVAVFAGSAAFMSLGGLHIASVERDLL